jgi:ATP-dependent Clp protease ATP-binding subunit ClpA
VGRIQVIGATTHDEYRKYVEKDKALERRFQPITVDEPTIEDSITILKGFEMGLKSSIT